MGPTKTALAEYLINRYPPAVRTRLLRDDSFCTRLELPSKTVLTVGGFASFDQRELFGAVRRVLAERKERGIVDIKGRKALVATEKGCIVIKGGQDGDFSFDARVKALMILSPHQDERERELEELLDYLGPTAPDFTELRSVAAKRELTDDEVGTLMGETIRGVVPLQARAFNAFEVKDVSVDVLVPRSFEYYERFCGPDPGDAEPETYLGVTLPAYRKELIQRHLDQGLDTCLFGALRDDLAPGAWTAGLPDDVLLDALKACDPTRDPYSLLGALDIALGRQHDERFRAFADQAVERLVSERYLRPDGNDAYELISLLAKLVLNRINTLEGGALHAPYWKRMCAWMQAAFLSRLTLPLKLELAGLEEWVNSNMTAAGEYAMILDLRREPMYRAAEMSPATFREEVVSRLLVLRSRHQAVGRLVPRSEEIDKAIAQIAALGSPLGWGLPGPLEGCRRPAETSGRKLPEEVATDVLEKFAPESGKWEWANLSYLSQYFEFNEHLLESARDAVKRCNFEGEGGEIRRGMAELIGACLFAAAHRDIGLARAIAEKTATCADKMLSEEEVVTALRLLLLAGTSFDNEEEWSKWLDEQFAELAFRLPRGKASNAFLEHIREIKKAMRLPNYVVARAEAIALAGN